MIFLKVGPLSSFKYSTQNQGGVATVMTSLFDYYITKNLNVHVLSTGKTNNKNFNTAFVKRFSFYNFLKLFLISFKFIFILEFKSFLIFNYYSLIFNIVDFDKYDFIHVHGLQGRIIDVIFYLNSKPIILTIHSYHEFMNKSRYQLRFWNKHLNKIFDGISEIIHVSYVDKIKGFSLGFNIPSCSKVVYNPIKYEKKIQTKKRNSEGIIFAGSLNKRKQIKVLIKSLDFLKSNIRLTICGGGEMKKEIQDIVSKSEKITFLGYLDNNTLLEEYQKNSLLVVPSLSESFGLVYLEAINSGLSVIGYNEIIREFHDLFELDENQTNILVPYKGSNPQTLSKLISKSLKFRKSKSAEPIIEELKIKIKRQFSINKISNDYIKIYESVK
ncbi:glycosyltransferase family 4 protein [Flavobacteriales bacterium]|nr:glycosyltransferase family 4 protein [Flavobacteriales bacterium]